VARQKEEEQKAREAMRKEEEQKKLKLKEEALEQQKEKLRLEQEKREQEKKVQQEKAEKLRQQQAQAQADAEKALKAQAAARNVAAQNMVGDYTGKIRAKIKSKTILPPDLAGNPQAEFDVTLMPTGEVLNLKLTRSSGSSAYDSAVERAIYKAQPLPLPPDPTLFGEFRELHLKFRLHED
jgi:colicin import membrane protein